MAQPYENKSIDDVLELLTTNGFDGLADAVTVLLNSAMIVEGCEYLGASPYERSARTILNAATPISNSRLYLLSKSWNPGLGTL